MPELVIAFERIEDSWQEFGALAQEEHEEINEERPFIPDWESMASLQRSGLFQVLAARVDGRMVGYFSWMIDFDIESKGTLIINQGAWFVREGYPTVGVKLFDRALEEFKRLGVKFAYLHHTCNGRGARLGKLYERRGAKVLGFKYVLNLSEKAK